jgi:outer membrane protein OmpA-like peptidoglycan-associated protein
VGSDISNLQLSDLRAATVARILTDFYGVPPENLATQGYGERYLKIRTQAWRAREPPRHHPPHHAADHRGQQLSADRPAR